MSHCSTLSDVAGVIVRGALRRSCADMGSRAKAPVSGARGTAGTRPSPGRCEPTGDRRPAPGGSRFCPGWVSLSPVSTPVWLTGCDSRRATRIQPSLVRFQQFAIADRPRHRTNGEACNPNLVPRGQPSDRPVRPRGTILQSLHLDDMMIVCAQHLKSMTT